MDDDDDETPEPLAHEVGVNIDALSVEELNERIGQLEVEIARLKDAIAARSKTRSEAESLFKH
jgi:uncharacterized small protein (DUF1192 family)